MCGLRTSHGLRVTELLRRKNANYWALTRDAVKPARFQKHPTKVHVWAAISYLVNLWPNFAK